jgi:uncharacterized protein (TIGR02453 family)
VLTAQGGEMRVNHSCQPLKTGVLVENMKTNIIIDFLNDLSVNNSLDWMKNNKKYYEQAKTECETLILRLIDKISLFDGSIADVLPKDLMFRLNRDTRFSSDKSPYNPSFRAHISPLGRTPIPAGYYLNIKPGHIFLGGGLFVAQFPEATKSVRDFMAKNENELTDIIEAASFSNNFVISGEKLKNIPKEYDQGHKYAEYLKHKAWDIEYYIKDDVFLDADKFVTLSAEIFKYMKPFNDFLNRALKDFKMPVRK